MTIESIFPHPLGFGSAPLDNMFRAIPEVEAQATVQAAWDEGIRYFDTAPFYGAGLAEIRLGRALAGKPRGDYVISTKIGRIVLDEIEEAPRDNGEKGDVLATFDQHGLLDEATALAADEVELGVDDLASELADLDNGSDINRLRHVRSAEEKRAAEEIARRDKCHDFEKFKPLFEQVKQDLASGTRVTRPFELKAEIRPGAFFIVGGLISYVAEMDDIFTNAQGRTDARLRVIFDNGTESGMLMRSLQRQLHEDDAGRRITDPSPGPLFADRPEDGEAETGTIYVLRSKSNHPFVT